MDEFRLGLAELKTEVRKWRYEMVEKFEQDPIFVRPGYFFSFFLASNPDFTKFLIFVFFQYISEN